MTDKRTPTGRFRASAPSLQNLPKMTTEDAQRLVQAFRNKHPDLYGAFKEAYETTNTPVESNHASIDDKGNVSVSVAKKPCRECCRHVWQVLLLAKQVDFCVMCYTTRDHIEGFKGMTNVEAEEAVRKFRLACVHQFEDDGVHTSPICVLCGAPKQ